MRPFKKVKLKSNLSTFCLFIQNEPLRISSDNIVVCDGRTQASLSLSKTGQIIGQADEIQLSDKQGEPQLMINENQFFSKIEKVTINSK